jgi:Skp family chaperone for outer membrane proteins
MKRKIVLLTLFTALLAFAVSDSLAVAGEKKKAEKLVKVGCVDIQRVFDSIPQKKEVQDKLDKMQTEFAQKKAVLEKDLDNIVQEYTNKKGDMSKNQLTEKNIQIATKRIELYNYIQDSNGKLSEQEDLLLQPVLKSIRNIIKEKAVQFGFSMIIDKSTYVIYVDKELDITKDVIEEINKSYKEQTIDEKRE